MSLVHRLMLKRLGLVATHEVSIRNNIRVRMPDGAELLTDVYRGSADASAPVIMIRSPYGKGAFIAGSTAYPLASQGFNVVLQCCRGTGGSSGTFDPHHDEQRDGLATLEWIKQQTWCNGVLATHGGSAFRSVGRRSSLVALRGHFSKIEPIAPVEGSGDIGSRRCSLQPILNTQRLHTLELASVMRH